MNQVPKDIPESPGVYFMKDAKENILYVGKAANLKRRVSSYFSRPHEWRIENLVQKIASIDMQITDSVIEALVLEAALIKKYQPPFNVREKDDTSFFFVEITKEVYPRVLLVRGRTQSRGKRFGPFTSATSIKSALQILRRIFSYNLHDSERIGKSSRLCLDAQMGLCPGTCAEKIDPKEYKKNIQHLEWFFSGKKVQIIRDLQKEMRKSADDLEFEKAEKIKRQIFSLEHIHDVAVVSDSPVIEQGEKNMRTSLRIEGYDISNISGTSAVGSMVVFSRRGGLEFRPDKNEYRKFKIQTLKTPNDVGMLQEVLKRRFHNDWPLPYAILIDGGKGQVNVGKRVLKEFGLDIPVVGIAKGPTRKKNEFIGEIPKGVSEEDLIRVRNEAHRFAISYHRSLRSRESLRG